MNSTKSFANNLIVGESPRWHQGRLWFSHWGAGEIVAVDKEGKTEVVAKVPTSIPFSIDWLPNGRLLVVSGPEAKLLRQEADGRFVTHADLSQLSDKPWNEIVVDGHGNTYVNCVGFRFGQDKFAPGSIALVTPDGLVQQVADDLAFPNGMVVTPDNATLIVAESYTGKLTAFDIAADGSLSKRRTWADLGEGGDGICLDAEGAVWTPAIQKGQPACIRVREGGQILQRIETENACFACMLGGPDGKTLFITTAKWPGQDKMDTLFTSRTGEIHTVKAPAAGAGWPNRSTNAEG